MSAGDLGGPHPDFRASIQGRLQGGGEPELRLVGEVEARAGCQEEGGASACKGLEEREKSMRCSPREKQKPEPQRAWLCRPRSGAFSWGSGLAARDVPRAERFPWPWEWESGWR